MQKRTPPPKRSPGAKPAPGKSKSASGFPRFHLILIILAVGAFLGLLYLLISKPPNLRDRAWPEPEARKATLGTNNHVYAGVPKALASTSDYVLLKNSGYWAGYSDLRKDPLWVGYRLDAKTNASSEKRPSKFSTDLRTRSRINHDDYDKSGFDRGHMAPNAGIAVRYGRNAQLETFFMSNVCPQAPNLNRKLWEKLERLESDKYAASKNGIWVVTGPVFDQKRDFLPSGVEIPDKFYKIMVDETPKDIDVQAFLIPQTVSGKEDPGAFLTSVDQIEKETNLDFFPAISDVRENRLESQCPNTPWTAY